MTTRLVLMTIALFGASAIQADEHVDKADANGDGFVSLYELRAAHYADPEFNKRIEQAFDRYDQNSDGLISADERQAQRDATMRQTTNPPTATRDAEAAAVSRAGGAMAVGAGGVPTADVRTTNERAPVIEDVPIAEVKTRDASPRNIEPSATRNSGSNSRTESWLQEIDADKSGGASFEELVESGGGRPWFAGRDFEKADSSGDGELDAAELAVLLSGLERRQR